jgi:hypothetical protein
MFRSLFPKSWRRCWAALRSLVVSHPRPAPGRRRRRLAVEALETRLTPSGGGGGWWGRRNLCLEWRRAGQPGQRPVQLGGRPRARAAGHHRVQLDKQ